jgi:ubiquitin-activating enzyme E1
MPEAVNAYAGQSDFLEVLAKQASSQIETLERIKDALVTSRPTTLEDCVAWARLRFSALFRDRIEQLLFNFPPGHTLSNGSLFWSGTKREPAPVVFNAEDSLHLEFITTATRLRGSLYGLRIDPSVHTLAWFKHALSSVHVPKFNPASGVVIAATEKEAEELKTKATGGVGGGGGASGGDASWDVTARASALTATLPPQSSLAGFRCMVVDFEKDDDLHISFVTACSNLRARVYRIEEKNKHESKLIAGKIIPAIATTTAVVSGLISLELYKLVANRPMQDFRSSFLNLAVPTVAQGEPIGVKKSKLRLTADGAFSPPPEPGSTATSAATALADGTREWSYSVWDRVSIDTSMTLKELIDFVKSNFGLDVNMISYGSALVYAMFNPPAKKRERLPLELGALCEKVAAVNILPHVAFISVVVNAVNEDGESVDLPAFRYRLPRATASGGAQSAVSAVTPAAKSP